MEYSRTLFPLLLPTIAKLESENLQPHSASTGLSGPKTQESLPLKRRDAVVLWKMYVPIPSNVAEPRTPSPKRLPFKVPLTHWAFVVLSVRQSVELDLPSHQPPQTASWLEEVLKAASPYRGSGSSGILHSSSSKPKVSTEESVPSEDSPPNRRRPGGERGWREEPENVYQCTGCPKKTHFQNRHPPASAGQFPDARLIWWSGMVHLN